MNYVPCFVLVALHIEVHDVQTARIVFPYNVTIHRGINFIQMFFYPQGVMRLQYIINERKFLMKIT